MYRSQRCEYVFFVIIISWYHKLARLVKKTNHKLARGLAQFVCFKNVTTVYPC